MGRNTLLGAGGGNAAGTPQFNPANYGNVSVWFDCSSSTYVLDSGGNPCAPDEAAQTLTDRSGNSRNGLQATGARQGVWRSAVKNGLGALDVTQSSSNWYSIQNGTNITNNIAGLTQAFTYSPDDISQFFCTMSMFTENSSWDPRARIRLIDQNGTDYRISFTGVRQDSDAASTVTPAVDYAKNNWHVLVVVADYANALLSIYVDNVAIYGPSAFQTAGNTDSTDSQINPPFCIQDPGLNFAYDGLIGDYVVYNEALTSGEVSALTTALGAKWAITV